VSREPDRNLLPLPDSQDPETSPRPRDPWSPARTQDLVSGSKA